MSEETRVSDADQAAEAAAHWFVRLKDEAASGDDWLAFEQWLHASPAHADAYDRLEVLSLELDRDRVAIEKALDAPAPAGERRRTIARTSGRPSRRAWLAAGALAACAVLGIGIANRQQQNAPFETYRTAPGETRMVVLADGTHINLNAGSTIRVSLGRTARRVEMADAEAVFDVTHDPARPFLITAGDRQVRVVGTEFNLRHRLDRVVLTVRRGVVEVRPAMAPEATPTRVRGGQQLVHRDGGGPAVLSAPGPDAAFAWTTGQLIYDQQPLSEVASDLTRRFATPVRLADPALGRTPFSGVLVTDNEADVLRRLEAFMPIRAERTADAIVLHRRTAAR
jgi:transmembrane sensor